MAIVSQTSPMGGWKDHKQSARRIRSETRSNDWYELKPAGGGADDPVPSAGRENQQAADGTPSCPCYALGANGPRSSLPGNAPVCSLLRIKTSPLTIVALIPSDFCLSRRAPAGRSYSMVGICGATVAGSKITTSAKLPSRTRPRPCSPQKLASSKVILRIACSSVNACRSLTQCPSRCVWIEESIICDTWAPESEKVTTDRGWRIIASTTS